MTRPLGAEFVSREVVIGALLCRLSPERGVIGLALPEGGVSIKRGGGGGKISRGLRLAAVRGGCGAAAAGRAPLEGRRRWAGRVAGRGLAAAGARPVGAPWCGRERSMGRRLLRALLCLLLVAGRGLLRVGEATAAHGERVGLREGRRHRPAGVPEAIGWGGGMP